MNIFTRRSIAAITVAVGLAGSAITFAVPAIAAPAASSVLPSAASVHGCPSGDACFWPFKNFAGSRGAVSGNNPDFSRFPHTTSECHTGTWNDCIESVANNGTQCTVYWWTGANYTGRWHSLSRGDSVGDFATGYNDPSFNDVISSNHWCTPN
jgi:peptidase inhibitor family I36